MESLGVRIKKIRLEKGLSLEEAQKKTRIHLKVLKAIEEDSVTNLSPIYLRGFLKIYCKFLKVDPKDFIADYKEPKYNTRPLIPYAEEKKLTDFIKMPQIKWNFLKKIPLKKVSFGILIIVFLLGLFYLGKAISSRRQVVGALKKMPAPAAQPQAARPKKIPAAAKIVLGILAKENCLIQVKLDGKVFFKDILMRGRFETWEAKDKIVLSVGNASAVELQVNGQPFLKLGKRGQPLKNIVITKEGVNIVR